MKQTNSAGLFADQEASLMGKTKKYTTREENCADKFPGKLGIGSGLDIEGRLMEITYFGKPYVKDGDRFLDFYTKEIQAVPTSTERKQSGGTYEV